MSRRKTVSVRIEKVEKAVENHGWSNVYFSEAYMKKPRGWLTEWKRGRNFPSPEEAARMCAILQVTPEQILTEPDDIKLVNELIDSQRTEKIPTSVSASGDEEEYIRLFKSLPPELRARELAYLRSLVNGKDS